MKAKKYRLIESITRNPCGVMLYKIQALRDVNHFVKKGALGGYIESEANLSHDGDCWVYHSAMIYNNALVSGNAQVTGRSWVYGDALVSEDVCNVVLAKRK